MNSISANLNIMIKAAEKASKILIRDFGELEKLQVSLKGPSDFVTNSDKKVEKIIIEELSKSRKKFSILGEEIGEIKNSDKENYWIIDPIDGTTNFLHGVPHFAISIALKTKEEIVSGLIFDPIKDEIFSAEKDTNIQNMSNKIFYIINLENILIPNLNENSEFISLNNDLRASFGEELLNRKNISTNENLVTAIIDQY